MTKSESQQIAEAFAASVKAALPNGWRIGGATYAVSVDERGEAVTNYLAHAWGAAYAIVSVHGSTPQESLTKLLTGIREQETNKPPTAEELAEYRKWKAAAKGAA